MSVKKYGLIGSEGDSHSQKDPDGQPIELIEVKPEIRSAEYSMEDKWVQEHKAQFGTEPSFM